VVSAAEHTGASRNLKSLTQGTGEWSPQWRPALKLSLPGVRWLTDASPDELRSLLERGEFFWLDLVRPAGEHVAELAEASGVDPEATERALRFGEVPQLRLFHGHAHLVFYGSQPTAVGPPEPVEVHVYVSPEWVVSLRQRSCRALEELHSELDDSPPAAKEAVVGRVLGALADSFDELMESADDAIARLEEDAADEQRPATQLRREILERRARLLRARRLVRRQRDYVERAADEIRNLAGFDPGQHHQLRDVAGQMIRTADRIDDALDRLANALDLLNSTVANRLNAAMERLTVVATIFLPLTVVTGFFGQNFGWMLDRIDSLAAFLVLGVGVFAVSGLLIYLWIRARLTRAD
jgi:magnesium transporter